MIKLSASFNPCPEEKSAEYCRNLQDMKVDYVHCDIMRENFVGHDALNLNTIKEVWDNVVVPLDVHIMEAEPFSTLKSVVKIKPHIITVHYESFKNDKDLMKAFDIIRKNHMLVGLSIKPNTFIKDIKHLLPLVDVVLVMGVDPGKSGQKMISNTIPKIKELRSIIYEYDYPVKIEVDGGVNEDNLKALADAGVDMVVMGSCLYNSSNRAKLIEKVHKL